jgi:hypothetical protein
VPPAANTLDGQVKGLDDAQADAACAPHSRSKLAVTGGALDEGAFRYPPAPPSSRRAGGGAVALWRRRAVPRLAASAVTALVAIAAGTATARRMYARATGARAVVQAAGPGFRPPPPARAPLAAPSASASGAGAGGSAAGPTSSATPGRSGTTPPGR